MSMRFRTHAGSPACQGACPVGRDCSDARGIMVNVITLDDHIHAEAVRSLLLHYVECSDVACTVCDVVSADLSSPFAAAAAAPYPRPVSRVLFLDACETEQLSATVAHLVWLLRHAMLRASAVPPHAEPPMLGGAVWKHVLTGQPDTSPVCTLSRLLLLHRLQCSHPTCEVCTRVAEHFKRPEAQDIAEVAAIMQGIHLE